MASAKAAQEVDAGGIGASVNILERMASFAVSMDKNGLTEKEMVCALLECCITRSSMLGLCSMR